METKLYDISRYGFLPENPIPKTIREPYELWLGICNNLPHLIDTNEIEEVVNKLRLINIDEKTTHQEYQMIYAMLCMIQAGWLWHRGEGKHKTFVPQQIAVPLDNVTKYLGIKPLITHCSIDLYNWRLIDESKPPELDNLMSAFTLTGDKSESWFCLVMVAIEYHGSVVINEIMKCYQEVNVNSLKVISTQLDMFVIVLGRMYEHCDPDHFYNVLRKFLAGWTNKELFPDGMHLESIGKNIRHTGGSAAQSSIIQVIDIFLGIEHKDNYLREMREYMPRLHRNFLTYLESLPKVRNSISSSKELTEAYNECVTKLSLFRSRHMGLIHSYILNMVKVKSALSAEGTGGSDLTSLLQSFRKETDDTKI